MYKMRISYTRNSEETWSRYWGLRRGGGAPDNFLALLYLCGQAWQFILRGCPSTIRHGLEQGHEKELPGFKHPARPWCITPGTGRRGLSGWGVWVTRPWEPVRVLGPGSMPGASPAPLPASSLPDCLPFVPALLQGPSGDKLNNTNRVISVILYTS